ncbi:MAG: hypothetical protein KAH01_05150 [Caldisericia bacterium]|nr:hypothetical protein [Caldisericia bacterium]
MASERPRVFQLGDGQYGYFIINEGLLIYANDNKDQKFKVPVRILQDITVCRDSTDDSMAIVQLVYNYEAGFEVILPKEVAKQARLWILSYLGMIDAKYRSTIEPKKKKIPIKKKTNVFYGILIVFLFVGILMAGFKFIAKPFFLTKSSVYCVEENPKKAEEYFQKAIQQENEGNLSSAITYYSVAVQYNPKSKEMDDCREEAIEKRIDNSLRSGNYEKAYEYVVMLSDDNESKEHYKNRLKSVSSSFSVGFQDIASITSLFFKTLVVNDLKVKEKFEDQLIVFKKKVEFSLR